MSKLRYIASVLCCFGALFAEDLTCIYTDEDSVILSDGSCWDLPEEDGPFFHVDEMVEVKSVGDEGSSYLVGQEQTVVAEFLGTISFEERAVRQAFPLYFNCEVTKTDEVGEASGVFQLVHTEQGDLMIFLSNTEELDQVPVGSSFRMAEDEEDHLWGMIHPVSGELMQGLRVGFMGTCTKREVSYIEDGVLHFKDGFEIDLLSRGDEAVMPQGSTVTYVQEEVSPYALETIFNMPSGTVVIHCKGADGLRIMIDVQSDEQQNNDQPCGPKRVVFQFTGPQELADFFGWGSFKEGDLLNVYSFSIDKGVVHTFFEDDSLEESVEFVDVMELINSKPCYLFERT